MPLKATWIYDIFYDRNTWCVPYVPVADCFAFLEAHKTEGFGISGVYGNNEHWNKKNAGGHTNRSTHALWGVLPKATHTDNVTRRYVPAIDYKLPDAWMARYQSWYVAALRANRFPYIQYINVNGHHYNRASGYAQEFSTDWHVHEHYAPGFEVKKVILPLAAFYNEVMHPEAPAEEDDMDDKTIIPQPKRADGTPLITYPDNATNFNPSLAYMLHFIASTSSWARQEQNAQGKLLDTVSDAVSKIDALDDQTKAAIDSAKADLNATRVEIAARDAAMMEMLKDMETPTPDPH